MQHALADAGSRGRATRHAGDLPIEEIVQRLADPTRILPLEGDAGVKHREHPAVVKILYQFHPRFDELAHLARVGGQIVEAFGEQLGGTQRQPHAGRQHRIDDPKASPVITQPGP